MRIAYIISLKEGIPSFVKRETEGLANTGFDVDLYATKIGEGVYAPTMPFVHTNYVRVLAGNLTSLMRHPTKYLKVLLLSLNLGTIKEFIAGAGIAPDILRRRTDVIHSAFGDRKLFVGFYAHELTGIPLSTMIHSHELTFYGDSRTFAAALNAASQVLTVCQYNRDILIERHPNLGDRLRVIKLSVDISQFHHDARAKVLTIAKFHDYKGYDVLVRAASLLRNRDIVFWVVGDGPIDVRRLAREMNLEHNFIVLGNVNEEILKILLQSCDIFCLPSRTSATGQKEGLPVSLMEAMAFSKPVVTTRHAGIPELVRTVLVNEGDYQGVADAIVAYVENRERMKLDGDANRHIVEDNHGPENIRKLAQAFQSILNE